MKSGAAFVQQAIVVDLRPGADGHLGNGIGKIAGRRDGRALPPAGADITFQQGQAGIAPGDNQSAGVGNDFRPGVAVNGFAAAISRIIRRKVSDIQYHFLRAVVRQVDISPIGEKSGIQGYERVGRRGQLPQVLTDAFRLRGQGRGQGADGKGAVNSRPAPAAGFLIRRQIASIHKEQVGISGRQEGHNARRPGAAGLRPAGDLRMDEPVPGNRGNTGIFPGFVAAAGRGKAGGVKSFPSGGAQIVKPIRAGSLRPQGPVVGMVGRMIDGNGGGAAHILSPAAAASLIQS